MTAPTSARPGDGRTRVLYLDHAAQLSGGEIALLNLVRHLDQSQYVPVVALFSDGPLRTRLEESGIETHLVPLEADLADTRKDTLTSLGIARKLLSGRWIGFVLRLSRFIRSGNYAIIHTNSLKADLLGGLAGMLARLPVVWHIRDRIADDYLPSAASRAVRHLCRFIPAYVIANSGPTLQTLRLPARKKASAIHSGVLTDRVAVVHDGTVRRPSAHHAAVDEAAPVIGLVGRIAPWKGQHVFLRAAAAVSRQYPHARFLIVGAALFGETEYDQSVRRLCTDLGIGACVEFTGFREDVADVIGGLSILVHASTVPEPFGQVVIEGMIAGKPVVATRGGGVTEIITSEDVGLLVPMGDDVAMARAIVRLLEDPALAKRVGDAGRQHVLSNFTIEQTARKVEAVYAIVMNRPSGPAR